ncbi:purine-cytosine permease family protein [Streptomyces sp. NPDC054770]
MNENRAPAGPTKRPLTEHHGISWIDDGRRHGRERDQFSIRFAPVVYLAPVVLGGVGIPLGLGLIGSITAIVVGNLLGSLATAACAVMGPRLGIPQVTMGRAAFGYRGNRIPAYLGILLFIGYFSLGTVLGARSLANLTGLPYPPMIVVVAGLSVVIAVFGYDTLQAVGQWLTRVSLVVFGTVSVAVVLHGTGSATASHTAAGRYLTTWLLVCSVVFSYTVSWTVYASDYSRYLPADGRARSMFLWAFGGIFTSATWMMVLGAALTMLAGGDPLAGLGIVLPDPLLKTVLVVLVIGALSHNAVNLYSGAMAGLTCDLPLRRTTVVVAGGAVGCVLSVLLGGAGFQSHFNTFLLMVSYFVMPWLAILLIDFYRTHQGGRRYPEPTVFHDRTGPYRGTRPRALLAFFLGIGASVPFMATDAYTGPIGHMLGGVDISYAASFVVAAVIYELLRKPLATTEPAAVDPARIQQMS